MSIRNEENEKMERKCSYESYRTLVQIDATGGNLSLAIRRAKQSFVASLKYS